MPALEALQRLTRLALHRTRVASLPALDTLLRLPRLRELEVGGSPVNRCALLRPYVAHRWVRLPAHGRKAGRGWPQTQLSAASQECLHAFLLAGCLCTQCADPTQTIPNLGCHVCLAGCLGSRVSMGRQ
jgi:hypothetical protein